MSLALLGEYISTLTQHAVQCKSPMNFLGDSQHQGLASTLVSQCLKCKQLLRCHTSKMVVCNEENHYATNVGAVLAQIATGGGASQLEEQLSYVTVAALSKKSFMHLECSLGTLFEATVSQQLLSAGKQERQLAVLNGCYHNVQIMLLNVTGIDWRHCVTISHSIEVMMGWPFQWWNA